MFALIKQPSPVTREGCSLIEKHVYSAISPLKTPFQHSYLSTFSPQLKMMTALTITNEKAVFHCAD
jgi:hypothetical protein